MMPPPAAEVLHREIEHRRRHEAEIHHVDALLAKAAHKGVAQLGRTRPCIAADRDAACSEHTRGGSADAIGGVRSEFARHHTPDVVGFEDRHSCDFRLRGAAHFHLPASVASA